MRPNLITRLKEEWNNLDPVDPLRGLIADAIDALAEHSTNRPTSRLDAYPQEQVAAAKEDVMSAVEHHGLSEQPAQTMFLQSRGAGYGPAPSQRLEIGKTEQPAQGETK